MAIRIGSTVSNSFSQRIPNILWCSIGGLIASGMVLALAYGIGAIDLYGKPEIIFGAAIGASALGAGIGNYFDPILLMDRARIIRTESGKDVAFPLQDPDVQSILQTAANEDEARSRILELAATKGFA